MLIDDVTFVSLFCTLSGFERPFRVVSARRQAGTVTDDLIQPLILFYVHLQFKIRPINFIEYHLFGGLIEIRGKRWEQARELLELVSPGWSWLWRESGLTHSLYIIWTNAGGHSACGEHFAITDGSAYEARPRQPDRRGQGTCHIMLCHLVQLTKRC